jgi:predicted CXXCH cytochrome family protein
MFRLPVQSLTLIVFGSALAPAATFTGSQACQTCHPKVYARWSKTRMANVVRDPKTNPAAVAGDFSKPNPLVTFKIADVAFVYGDKWKQRYFYKRGNDYFVYPAQWDVQNKVWRAYHPAAGGDWWVAHYPDAQDQRPTGPLCDGCHSVNYNTSNHQVTEWNVGCEKCHGPGSDHVAKPTRANIVNPAHLDPVRANDTCLQCHTQGQPLKNPIQGQYYDWPVGFTVGEKLSDYWKLEDHKLGEKTFTHFPDGTADKNRMQGNDFVQSQMYKRGITCFACHDVHGTENNADLLKPANVMCSTCHGPKTPNGPPHDAITHSHHPAGSEGVSCAGCHMPKIEAEIADVNVRSHTFKFMPPLLTTQFKEPNSCNTCHKDKDAAWAEEALSHWDNVSPWRLQ